MEHLSDTDLERHCIGMIPDGPELVALEEHLLICGECVDRVEEAAHSVDMIRAWIIERNWDRDASNAEVSHAVRRKVPPGAVVPGVSTR